MKTCTITLKARAPRNLYVAASLQRKSGAHRKSGGALRRRAEQALRRLARDLDTTESGP